MDFNKSIKAIIIAHLEGELQGEELKRLTSWVAKSKANTRYYAKVKDLWEVSLSNVSQIAETEKEWSKFLKRIKTDNQPNISRFGFTTRQLVVRVAAILIIGLLTGGFVVKYLTKHEPYFITVVAPEGSVSEMIVGDSTLVYLNAGSEIRYSPESNKKKREVYLKGEAWFDVTKIKNKPFVVHTPYYDVNVTGTQFNVKSYEADQEITTTLEEGEIIISSSEKFKLAKNIILKPGEQVVFNKNSNRIETKMVDTELFTAWRNNRLMFLNMSVKELIVLLERKFGVEIEVNDPNILKYHYTGTIKNESILKILDIIKHTLPIQYKIEGQIIKINSIGGTTMN